MFNVFNIVVLYVIIIQIIFNKWEALIELEVLNG